MVTPQRSLRLLGYTALLLAFTLYLLPDQVNVTDQFAVRTFTLRSVFEKEDIRYADIAEIQQKFSSTDADAEEVVPKPAPVLIPEPEKVQTVQTITKPDSLEKKYLIQLPEDHPDALKPFFRSLSRLSQTPQLIRVLHYGDSQIEGDRITASLRKKMQERFGGCGVGLVPLINPLGGRNSISQTADKGWSKFIPYGPGYSDSIPRSYGIMGSYYTFATPEYLAVPDSVNQSMAFSEATGPVHPAPARVSVDFIRSPLANRRDRMFDKVKLLYRNAEAPFTLHIQAGADTLASVRLEATAGPQLYQQFFRKEFKQIKLTFESTRSPELFGVALDCNAGVAVDNIAFRGSSGVEFTRMNRELLKQQINTLNVKCIILQFGVNVAPYEVKSFAFYERQLYNQLTLLRSLAPGVSILVVGVSDMSRKEGEHYVSYPSIEKIRDAQRNAAFRAGCAFWDLYEAMGGKNSMPSWVAADPPLANKDYTHFSPKGARLVSEMLYEALMNAYETDIAR